jgi:hypothetical protein
MNNKYSIITCLSRPKYKDDLKHLTSVSVLTENFTNIVDLKNLTYDGKRIYTIVLVKDIGTKDDEIKMFDRNTIKILVISYNALFNPNNFKYLINPLLNNPHIYIFTETN